MQVILGAENITFPTVKRLPIYRLIANAERILKSQGENMKTTCTIVIMLTLSMLLTDVTQAAQKAIKICA